MLSGVRVIASFFTLLLLTAGLAVTPVSSQDGLLPGACRTIDPNDAIAKGHGVALRVTAPLLGINREFSRSESSSVGPGTDSDSAAEQEINVPGDGKIAHAALLTSNTNSEVTDELHATQVSTAEVANISLLDGAITARIARAHGTTFAMDGRADLTGNTSAIEELVVDGVAYHQVAPNTRIPLPVTFGEGSYVKVYERIDLGFFPSHEKPWYRANLTIRMLHVKVVNPAVEIVVAETNSYSQSPTPYCGGLQGVFGSAYVSRIRLQPFFFRPSILVGETKIPITGGFSEQTYTNISTPFDQNFLKVDTAWSRTNGHVDLGSMSAADSYSKLQGVCIQRDDDAPDECTVKADVIYAESHSRAFPDPTPPAHDPGDVDTQSWGTSFIANLTVNGVDVCEFLGLESQCKPPQNGEPIEIGDITIWLNQRRRDMDPEGHTEYWVYALKIEADDLGVVTLGRAYTGADYGTSDDT